MPDLLLLLLCVLRRGSSVPRQALRRTGLPDTPVQRENNNNFRPARQSITVDVSPSFVCCLAFFLFLGLPKFPFIPARLSLRQSRVFTSTPRSVPLLLAVNHLTPTGRGRGGKQSRYSHKTRSPREKNSFQVRFDKTAACDL